MYSYVNGSFVPHNEALVHIDDRGYQFADSIYEVIMVIGRKLIDGKEHFERLKHSLSSLSIPLPMPLSSLESAIHQLLRKNKRQDGMLYIQITRGTARRNHAFPNDTKPNFIMTISPLKSLSGKERSEGVSVVTADDIRWARRDIKSTNLLPNVLAKQKASEEKAKEAWLVGRDGIVAEGSSSNAYIVDTKNTIITHPKNTNILSGVTRNSVLKLARKAGIKVTERPFSLKEAFAASEAFMTGTASHVTPIVHIDNKKIGDGNPGVVTKKLMALYDEYLSVQNN